MMTYRTWLGVIAFFLVGLNLRPGLTSVGPLLSEIQRNLALNSVALSFLTMLPVLSFGLFGPLAPKIATRFGLPRSVLALTVLLAAGLFVRYGDGPAALFGGTLTLAAAIGMISVMMPAVVRANWPQHVGLMMGIFTMSLCLGAAAGAGLTAPLSHLVGTREALAAWGLLALPALLLWALALPMLRGASAQPSPKTAVAIWRQPKAWQVTAFMASQSSLAFITFGWLPVMLQDRGLPLLVAGPLASLSMIVQAVTALIVPTLAVRNKSQSIWATGIMVVTALGFVIVLLAPTSFVLLGVIVLGLGQGGSFALALTLIPLRSDSPMKAAAMSGMVQSLGSMLASSGPFLVGLLRPADGDWRGVVLLLLSLATAATVFGLFAGRPDAGTKPD